MQSTLLPQLKIGSLSLATPVLLAPMAGYTDLPFRSVIRPLGGIGLAYSEMISPESILYGKGKRRDELLATTDEDRPLAHQIYGTNPHLMAEAARWLEEHGAILVDINMGCPQKEITSAGAGAGLLKSPTEAVRLAERVVSAVSIPVTVKLRLGWDEGSMVAVGIAREMARVGVAAITIHGRTREQRFSGEASLDGIRRVVEAVDRIPVIGNGDVTTPEAGFLMLQQTGCAGIMLGRGATKNPWLPRDLWRALQGLPPLPQPTQSERLALLREQFERSRVHYGETYCVPIFRRWIAERARSLGWDREKMVHILKIGDIDEFRQALQ